LHLLYEQALTRHENINNKWYNLSTHFPWIGMRTADLKGGHVEYMRGIANPIAVKISPQITKDSLVELINVLNPQNEPGRLTLIHRLGAAKVVELLPDIIKTVQQTGKTVLWVCDPMHGNTSTTSDGIKTRRFDDILFELQQSFTIHQKTQSYLGGVHFEMTGENVTECMGGARGLTESDLKRSYKSLVDPRLNYEQALEMAMLIVKMQG
jgi:3-deoxy-7-phosphoheptulonate synthase